MKPGGDETDASSANRFGKHDWRAGQGAGNMFTMREMLPAGWLEF
jgi:hypothetical protein